MRYDLRCQPFQLMLIAWLLLLTATGCWTSTEKEVVIYSALDREFSEPILNDFAQQTGVKVLPKYDAESTKTVGLVNRLLEERKQPRCDIFWNNEILHTLRLEKEGLLEVYQSPAAAGFPSTFVSADHYWHGFAARARVLIINTELLPEAGDRPASILALADPKWKDRCGLAKPLFGTTATHAAVLYDEWGEQRAQQYFAKVRQNAQVLSGNKQVAQAVARGQIAWGLTDTDDAIIELEAGHPVVIAFPDQSEGQMGTLFIPNTVAIIKGGPNPEYARMLVDYLLSPAVEKRLAEGRSAQFPLGPSVSTESRVTPPGDVKWIEADFRAAADAWPEAAEYLREEFVAPK